MTRNQLQYWANKEIERSNRVNEAERERANRASESIKGSEIDVKRQDLDEKRRHNKVDEGVSIANAVTSPVATILKSAVPSVANALPAILSVL